ncbi:MAG: S8 family serine peptidase [Synergistaceae bacterium]|nr:S8 family serine peptidase [Synergistaceae bacterium]
MKRSVYLFVLSALIVLSPFAFLTAARGAEYIEGEAIAVIRGGSASAAGRSLSASSPASAVVSSGGSVIQLFSPLTEEVSNSSGKTRSSAAGSGSLTVAHLRAADGESTEEFIARLKENPNVVSAMPNYISRLQSARIPNDPLWSSQWGPAAMKAPELWSHGTGTAETVVAVIDSGVIYDHPDLKDNMFVISNELADAIYNESGGTISGDFAGSHGAWYHSEVNLFTSDVPYPAIPIGPAPTLADAEISDINDISERDRMRRIGDITGHGTHVAGIIGAAGNNETGVAGVNWKVRIMPVNVFSYYFVTGDTALLSDIIRGIDFVIAAKRAGANIRVANISLGGWLEPAAMEGSAYDLKIKELNDLGVLLCIAAGNDGEDIDSPANSSRIGKRFYPACFRYENTLSVGALKEEGGVMSPDGSYTDYSSSGKWVDIFAPGTAILSTCRTSRLLGSIWDASGYKSINGTSMAAPHVAAAAALLFSLDQSKSAAEVKALLLETADGSVAKEGYSAYGALDLYAAWKKGFGGTPVAPVSPDVNSSGDILPVLAALPTEASQVAGIFDGGQLINTENGLYLDFDIVERALTDIGGGRKTETISLFPVFAAENGDMTAGRLCAAAFELDGAEFAGGSSRENTAVFKVKPDGSRLEYYWAANKGEYADGRYTIFDENGNIFNGSFESGKKYTIMLFIKDNGEYDLDSAAGRIVDPATIVSFKKDESSGGCQAAGGLFSIFALLIFALPAAFKKNKG